MNKSNIPSEHHLYQTYSIEEETERTNYHYECPPEFYYKFIGGEWNSYSCILWPRPNMTVTEAEEAKFDHIAKLLGLKQGMRILDVGAGWGGPLTYLCRTYGCTGVGLMLSEKQQQAATERAQRHRVKAEFHVCHWQNFTDEVGFDAVYTDEVVVHFNNLQGFFDKVWSVLKMGGLYLDKELHYTHPRYTQMNRAMEHINAAYSYTGNYRLLHDQLRMLNEAGMELVHLEQIPLEQYRITMDGWISRFRQYEAELIALSNEQFAKDFRKYMKLVRIGFNRGPMTMEIMVGRKIDPTVNPWEKSN